MNMKKYVSAIFIFGILVFFVYAQNAFRVNQEGNVGIGIENATEKLEVDGNIKANGRLKDKTGFVMPVGTILPFGGPPERVPAGWLVCDGRSLLRDDPDFTEIFEVIGTAWGTKDADSFNIPDLRGMFLRGLDDMKTEKGAGERDPDAELREGFNGGNTGNYVGSKQEDAFQGHWHRFENRLGGRWGNVDKISTVNSNFSYIYNTGDPISDTINGEPRTSSETRPKNVYVNFIIKY
jgi:hypothetical protein